MISNFSMIPICWLLTVDSEMASFLFRSHAEHLLFFFLTHAIQEKLICLTGEFHSKVHLENRYCIRRFVIHVI